MNNGKKCNLRAVFVLFAAAALSLTGCDQGLKKNIGFSDLNNPDLTVRILAIKWAGDNEVSEAVPLLVDLLEHEDRSVRFYAIEGLKRITGTDNGYKYCDDPVSRAAAVETWKKKIEEDDSVNGKKGDRS